MELRCTHISVYSTVIKLLALLSLYSNCKAVQLHCDSDKLLEVKEGTANNNVTCSGLGQTNTVEWYIDSATYIGSCSVPTNGQDTCSDKLLAPVFVPSRKEITESVMMIDTTNPSNNNKIENKTLRCQIPSIPSQTSSCTMDLIFPAEGNCFAKFITQDNVPWSLSTECNISKVYSSLGRYKCEFYSVLLNKETSISTQNSPTFTNAGGKYKSFSCVFTGNMPSDEGLYNYKAIITPGRKTITATSIDSLEILLPNKSAVGCSPSPDVPENTNVTCTCNTNNIGKPGGRLKWYRGNSQIGIGKYGDSALVMSQTLYRGDSNVIQFRCDVDWTSVINGDSFTISVGYVDQSVIQVNNLQNLSVAENQTVTFNCKANGRPTPSMSLINKDNGTVIGKATSPLTHTLIAAQCEDTSTYSCIANNGMGKDTTSTANLYVNCKPRITPGFDISSVNYMNKTELQVFTLVAYPSPDNFTFIYLGSDLNIAKVPPGIYLNVTCSPTQLVYNNTCTLTVDHVSPSAVGLYKVIIGNMYGSVNFTIKVNITGPIPTESHGDKINVAAIVGGIVAGVLIIAAIIVIVIIKRRNKGTKDSGRSCFKDKSPLHKRQKDDSYPECKNKDIDGSKINHAFSPESQHAEPPPTSVTTTTKQGIIKEVNPPTAGISGTNQDRGISNLPLLMQPPVLQSRSKSKPGKSDQNKRKKGKKFEGTKESKDGEYENVSLPTKATAGDAKRKTHQNKNKGKESQTNAEGIMYMELDFSQSKNNKPVQPKPVEEHVEYAPIDFSKHTS